MKFIKSFAPAWDFFSENVPWFVVLVVIFMLALRYQNAIDEVESLKVEVKLEQANNEVLRQSYISETGRFNAEVAQERLERGLLIAEIEKASLKREADSKAKYATQIARLGLDFKRESERLKDAFNKRLKIFAPVDNVGGSVYGAGVSGVQGSAEAGAGEGEAPDSGVPSTASKAGYTGSEPECHADLADLIRACQLTTIHFNRAREWIDTACQTVKCGEEVSHGTAP